MYDPARRDAVRTIAAGATLAACAPLRSLGATRLSSSMEPPPLPREFRAAWVATVDNIDWPSAPALPTRVQREEIRRIVDACAAAGLNAILLQVRPTADALYRSRLEPWSAFLTGQQGRAPVPGYDPLEVWLELAHGAGLDLHAWVNPFRVRHPKSIGRDAPTHLANRRPDLVRAHGPYLWLDPGEPDARDDALRIVDDLLTRYPIDGVHMDDYFYPYPQDKPFPDTETYRAHRDDFGRGLPLEDWRRANINLFIQQTRALVHERRPGSIFTVSPFGIWRPGNPPGIKGFDAFEGLHADSRRWLAEGWVDALMPQLYWPVESAGQPFEPLLDWWRAQNDAERHIWPGLYLTRIKPEGSDEKSWTPGEIVRQIEIIRSKPDANGFALFSAVGLTENRRGVADRLSALNANPAFIPESPWATPHAPGRPIVTRSGSTVRLTPGRSGGVVRRWAVQFRTRDEWHTLSIPGTDRRAPVPTDAPSVRVVPIGSNGASGPAVTTS